MSAQTDLSNDIANGETTEDGTQASTESTGGEEAVNARSDAPFGGLSPSEAGRRSAEARREAKAARDARIDDARMTTRQRLGVVMSELSLQDMRDVRDGLLAKAKRGDEKALGALVRMLDQSFGRAQVEADAGAENEAAPWEAMSPAQRAQWRAVALAQVEGQETPSMDTSDPRGEGRQAGTAGTGGTPADGTPAHAQDS